MKELTLEVLKGWGYDTWLDFYKRNRHLDFDHPNGKISFAPQQEMEYGYTITKEKFAYNVMKEINEIGITEAEVHNLMNFILANPLSIDKNPYGYEKIMKLLRKLTAIFLLFISPSLIAQPDIQKVNYSSLKQIIADAPAGYSLHRVDSVTKDVFIRFINASEKEVTVNFRKLNGSYTFIKADGQENEIVNFWKKHFDGKANMDEITKKGMAVLLFNEGTEQQVRFVLKKDAYSWSIVTRL